MSSGNKGITEDEIAALFIESSDDEVDELECEELYDSTEYVEYVPQLESESSDIDSDVDELPKRCCKKPIYKRSRTCNYRSPPTTSTSVTPSPDASHDPNGTTAFSAPISSVSSTLPYDTTEISAAVSSQATISSYPSVFAAISHPVSSESATV